MTDNQTGTTLRTLGCLVPLISDRLDIKRSGSLPCLADAIGRSKAFKGLEPATDGFLVLLGRNVSFRHPTDRCVSCARSLAADFG